jgi:hypothetical protein
MDLDNTVGHFELVNYQLKLVSHVLSATALVTFLPFCQQPDPHTKPQPQVSPLHTPSTPAPTHTPTHPNPQLRNALALATVLNRAVILPELWCGLDRYWAPHAGTLPGSKFKLPFICPADHILDLENGWARAMDK